MSKEAKSALINIKDLAGLSAPLTKLIETVGSGFGRISDGVSRMVSTYWLATKDAQNEAERIQLVEGAKTQILAERARMLGALAGSPQRELKRLDVTGNEVSAELVGVTEELSNLQKRSEHRASYENLMQQINWEAVTGFAAEVLAEETIVSEEPVSIDWTTRLRGIAQDVSSEEMQALWGKLLAGEVKKPGSYSLRTLEVLRNLTQQEAAIFQKIAGLVVVNYSNTPAYHFIHKSAYIDKQIDYDNLLQLFDCGLVAPVVGAFSWSLDEKTDFGIRVGSKALHIEGIPTLPEVILRTNVYNLTAAGAELMNLVSLETPIEYLVGFAEVFKHRKLNVSYASFLGVGENGMSIDEPIISL